MKSFNEAPHLLLSNYYGPRITTLLVLFLQIYQASIRSTTDSRSDAIR